MESHTVYFDLKPCQNKPAYKSAPGSYGNLQLKDDMRYAVS